MFNVRMQNGVITSVRVESNILFLMLPGSNAVVLALVPAVGVFI